MIIDRNERERGSALIAGIIVSTIVMLLGFGALALSEHSNQLTSDDRRATQGLHAAEAGVNRVVEAFARDFPNTGVCGNPPAVPTDLTDAGQSVGVFEYEVRPTPSDPACQTRQRLIRSWGYMGQYSEVRTLEVIVEVLPVAGFRFALFAGCPSGNTTCGGRLFSEPNLTVTGDIYTLNIDQAQPNFDVTGDVISAGDISTKPGATIIGNVWAGGSANIQNNADVIGNPATCPDPIPGRCSSVLAATGSVTLGSGAEVEGKATAGGAILGTGTATGGSLGGQTGLPSPPTIPLPVFDSNAPNLPLPRRTPDFTSVAAANTFFTSSGGRDLQGTYVVKADTTTTPLDLSTAHTVQGPTTIVIEPGTGQTDTPIINFGKQQWSTTGAHQLVIVNKSALAKPGAITTAKTVLPANLCTLLYTTGQVNIAQAIDMSGAIYATAISNKPNTVVRHCPDLVENPPAGFEFPLNPGEKYQVRPILWREVPPSDPPSSP